ncbi:MAG: hypothetical protein ABMB14_38430, partial [Myxococcota bacterium]
VGPSGADGVDGIDGVDGANGATGAQGAKGDKGDRGDVGPQGPQGVPGLQGPTGPAGVQGLHGVAGAAGADAMPQTKGDLYVRNVEQSVGAAADVVVTCDDLDDILLTGGCLADGPVGEFVLIESYPSYNGVETQFASWTCRVEETAGGVAPYTARAFCIEVP